MGVEFVECLAQSALAKQSHCLMPNQCLKHGWVGVGVGVLLTSVLAYCFPHEVICSDRIAYVAIFRGRSSPPPRSPPHPWPIHSNNDSVVVAVKAGRSHGPTKGST